MLRVIQAFGDYVVGESITDSSKIAAVLDTDQAAFVVQVTDPEPEPEPTAARAKGAPEPATTLSSAS